MLAYSVYLPSLPACIIFPIFSSLAYAGVSPVVVQKNPWTGRHPTELLLLLLGFFLAFSGPLLLLQSCIQSYNPKWINELLELLTFGLILLPNPAWLDWVN